MTQDGQFDDEEEDAADSTLRSFFEYQEGQVQWEQLSPRKRKWFAELSTRDLRRIDRAMELSENFDRMNKFMKWLFLTVFVAFGTTLALGEQLGRAWEALRHAIKG